MVFGQLFTDNPATSTMSSPGEFDFGKFLNDQPDLILTNGMAFKYLQTIGSNSPGALDTVPPYPRTPITINSAVTPFKVFPGELTRWYIFNAGPNDGVAFHFIGTYQNDYYGYDPTTGRLMTHDLNDQVNWIPPADGQVIEAKFPPWKSCPVVHPGAPCRVDAPYTGVDHNMNHVIKGAAFAVSATYTARPGDQPSGTWVPPVDSRCVSSEQQAVCLVSPLAAVANATK